MTIKNIPSQTIDRLFTYFRALTCLIREGTETVSSKRLAEICRVSAAVVRKDFSYFGEFGTRGVGYNVKGLLDNIRRILDFDSPTEVALVGVGNVGRALLQHSQFELEGFKIALAFDKDPRKVGRKIGSVTVQDTKGMGKKIRSRGIDLVILAVPDSAAPGVAKSLAKEGLGSILSFSPCELAMPDGIKITCVDLSMEMARLLYHSRLQSRLAEMRLEG